GASVARRDGLCARGHDPAAAPWRARRALSRSHGGAAVAGRRELRRNAVPRPRVRIFLRALAPNYSMLRFGEVREEGLVPSPPKQCKLPPCLPSQAFACS